MGLPASRTPLLGREREIAELAALVSQPDTRMVTVTGPGGVGKTRLALATGAEVAATFPAGVVFVDLSPLHSAALVVSAVASAVGAPASELQPLSGHIGDMRLLLIVDNC